MANFRDNLSLAVLFVVAVWFLYLAVKIAQHVGAWPFG